MCKVFKLKTKTGLVTITTDQSIVSCLIDNYDDELVITICKESDTIEEKPPEIVDANAEKVNEDIPEIFQFTLYPYSGIDKLSYVKDLKDFLQISLSKAKDLADNGGIVYQDINCKVDSFDALLEKHKVSSKRIKRR